MKTLRILILGLLATTALCQAQDEIISTNQGWLTIDAILNSGATNNNAGNTNDGSPVQMMANFQPQTAPTPPVIAEVITPEIQALADGMQDNPLRIYNYVHDHIRHVLYCCWQTSPNF